MNNFAEMENEKEEQIDRSKDFLKNLCRDLSLTRLKQHSFMDIITQNDVKRKIDTDEESQWISVIFVKGDNLQFIFNY